jgi:hypothetical protein
MGNIYNLKLELKSDVTGTFPHTEGWYGHTNSPNHFHSVKRWDHLQIVGNVIAQ